MNRPHIRFNGTTLEELPEKWSHAQNDALGYSLWLFSLLAEQNLLSPSAITGMLSALSSITGRRLKSGRMKTAVHGRNAQDLRIQYWHCTRRSAGSRTSDPFLHVSSRCSPLRSVSGFSQKHQRTDFETVTKRSHRFCPSSVRQDSSDKLRAHDAALLFLIFPLNVVPSIVADQIITNTLLHLEGPYGIRRYQGDSYWCANYRNCLMQASVTSDFSDSLSERDKLLIPEKKLSGASLTRSCHASLAVVSRRCKDPKTSMLSVIASSVLSIR